MLAEQTRLNQELDSIELQLSTLPKGKLICSQASPSYYKWYHSDGHQKTYIPKKNLELAQKLAIKKYLSAKKDDITQELCAINFYLRHHNIQPDHANKLLTEHPEYSKLLSPYFTPLSQELSQWANTPYQTNPNHPEHLIHQGASKHLVRSKSEAIIDLLLYTNKIPYRYECVLQLGDLLIYPDFTIRHPLTGKTYYWEHFGLMDDPHYCKNAYMKLQQYSAHGIYPSIQLITTFETKQNPLSIELVSDMINHYFL